MALKGLRMGGEGPSGGEPNNMNNESPDPTPYKLAALAAIFSCQKPICECARDGVHPRACIDAQREALAETPINTEAEVPDFSHVVTFHDGADRHPHRALIYFRGTLLVDQPADDWTMNLFPEMVEKLNGSPALTQLRAENEKLRVALIEIKEHHAEGLRHVKNQESELTHLKAELERANGLLGRALKALECVDAYFYDTAGQRKNVEQPITTDIRAHLNPKKTP